METLSILNPGEKIHIITRRLFADDLRRHFVGEVTAIRDGRLRTEGYTFVFDSTMNQFVKHPDLRTRVFSLDSQQIINVLPKNVSIGKLMYKVINKVLTVTDEQGFSLEVNEFGLNR